MIKLNEETVAILGGEIIQVCRRLYDRGLNITLSGNISARIDDNYVIMTPSGLDKYNLTVDQLSILDLNGDTLISGPKQSSEYQAHTQIYRSAPHVRAVVHAHPQTSLSLVEARGIDALGLGSDINPNIYSEAFHYIGKFCVVGPFPSASGRLVEEIVQRVKGDGATIVLMEKHGTIAVGGSLSEALSQVEALEHIAAKRMMFYLLSRA